MQTAPCNTYNLSLLADVAICDHLPKTDPTRTRMAQSLMLREVGRQQQLFVIKSHLVRPWSQLSGIEEMRAVLLKYKMYSPTIEFVLAFDNDPACLHLPFVGGTLDTRRMNTVPLPTGSRGRYVVFRLRGLFDAIAFVVNPLIVLQ